MAFGRSLRDFIRPPFHITSVSSHDQPGFLVREDDGILRRPHGGGLPIDDLAQYLIKSQDQVVWPTLKQVVNGRIHAAMRLIASLKLPFAAGTCPHDQL